MMCPKSYEKLDLEYERMHNVRWQTDNRQITTIGPYQLYSRRKLGKNVAGHGGSMPPHSGLA